MYIFFTRSYSVVNMYQSVLSFCQKFSTSTNKIRHIPQQKWKHTFTVEESGSISSRLRKLGTRQINLSGQLLWATVKDSNIRPRVLHFQSLEHLVDVRAAKVCGGSQPSDCVSSVSVV